MRRHIEIFLKKHSLLRSLTRRLYMKISRCRYNRHAKNVVISDILIFEAFMGRQYSCNPRAIYEYMITDHRFDDFRFVWAFEAPEKMETFPQLQRANIVKYGSHEYYQLCASAKCIVTNSNLDDGIVKKNGQMFLQTWHGTPLKRLRCDIEAMHGNANNTASEIKWKNDIDIVRYDYLLSYSDFVTDKFISAFNLENLNKTHIVVRTGAPRTDTLLNYTQADAEAVRKRLNIDDSRKVILYAPTFRDNNHEAGKGYVYDLHMDFDMLSKELSEEYIILFRAHYFVANDFDFRKYRGFIIDVSGVEDVTELYLISDILITDYSSVLFDYGILRRPMYFYMYDLKAYQQDIRGFYMDLDELPGPVVRTEKELLEAIKTNICASSEDYDEFNGKYNSRNDGNVSKRVADLIWEKIN